MTSFRWTKFQDFYLRLGFLKILVLLSEPARRSVSTELLVRRIKEVIFPSIDRSGRFWREVCNRFPWFKITEGEGSSRDGNELLLVKGLLLLGDCPSVLYGVTPKTAYKIVDWGRNVGILGPGNQITENGLLLRYLLDLPSAEAFLSGDHLAWNPFVLTSEERILFLFFLGEIDQLSLEVLLSLGIANPDVILEARDAGEITCRALFRVLDQVGSVSPRELTRVRAARELACVMARELALEEYASRCIARAVPRQPSLKRLKREAAGRERRTTKNTDHQAIPRFEQLLDLGFLVKPMKANASTEEAFLARRRWRYRPTHACKELANVLWLRADSLSGWTSDALASVSMAAGLSRDRIRYPKVDSLTIARLIWDAYKTVRRPAGHTPAYSVAVLSTVRAAASGIPVEMRDVHSLLLKIKTSNLAPDHAFFASGNELDKMFVVLRPGLLEKLSEALSMQEGA